MFFEYCILTWISTITEMTRWRSFQLVNVERATVANTDVSWPAAAVITPVEADFGVGNLTRGRVTAWEPPWCMRPTTIRWYTTSGHLVSWCSWESVPLSHQSIVTSVWWSVVSLCSRGIVKHYVAIASAFYNSKWKNKTMLLPRTDRAFIYCSFKGPPCRFREGIVLRLDLFSRPLQLILWIVTILILFYIILRFMVGI